MMKSQKLLEKNNPIQDVLEFFPDNQLTSLDPLALDDLRRIIFSKTDSESFVTDSYIVLLLKHLQEAGLVEIFVESVPNTQGKVLFCKKVVNGESTQ